MRGAGLVRYNDGSLCAALSLVGREGLEDCGNNAKGSQNSDRNHCHNRKRKHESTQ